MLLDIKSNSKHNSLNFHYFLGKNDRYGDESRDDIYIFTYTHSVIYFIFDILLEIDQLYNLGSLYFQNSGGL